MREKKQSSKGEESKDGSWETPELNIREEATLERKSKWRERRKAHGWQDYGGPRG